ncbi:hypothetical protein I7I48_07987 [Histoplasma ohiense]|nr:hypothetical protein I7I48_07987 [Histoplasma ohiense (nom. inval.)]
MIQMCASVDITRGREGKSTTYLRSINLLLSFGSPLLIFCQSSPRYHEAWRCPVSGAS